MKQKTDYLEEKIQANFKKGVLFGYLPVGILIALYAVFLVCYPLLRNPPITSKLLFNLTYAVGVVMLVHTGLYQNYKKKTIPEKRYLADGFWYVLAYAICLGPILFVSGVLLGKYETSQGYYIQNLGFGLATSRNISIYGAMLAGPFLTRAMLLLPHYRERKKAYMDLTVMAILCIIAFGKLDCHASGCCEGVHMDMMLFGRWQFPVQLLEAICIFLTIGFLMWYLVKAKWAIPGSAYALGLLLYCPVRFFWEFLREQTGYIKMFVFDSDLTFWQFLSIIGFVMGAVWMAYIVVKDKKEKTAPKIAKEAA